MKELLKKIQNLNKQLNALHDELEVEFRNGLKKIFLDNPKLHNASCYLNNHEFNDGDQTTFYVNFDDFTLSDVEGEEFEDEKISEELRELFGWTEDIHERIYGDEYESLLLERDVVLKKG